MQEHILPRSHAQRCVVDRVIGMHIQRILAVKNRRKRLARPLLPSPIHAEQQQDEEQKSKHRA
ncbi:hypothetical protein CPB85DRAFT_980879 [Mucidula mucida]|nr:hypothetical protein CPB85DRAFT_980879 [Mucidula mucida]